MLFLIFLILFYRNYIVVSRNLLTISQAGKTNPKIRGSRFMIINTASYLLGQQPGRALVIETPGFLLLDLAYMMRISWSILLSITGSFSLLISYILRLNLLTGSI